MQLINTGRHLMIFYGQLFEQDRSQTVRLMNNERYNKEQKLVVLNKKII